MNTTRYLASLPVVALIVVPPILLMGLLTSCSPASAIRGGGLAQVKVDGVRYMGDAGDPFEAVCLGWSLTPEQVRMFFELSRQYDENPYSEFYQVPCMIAGQISSEGRAWRFEINGGGTSTWSANGQVRHWGCRAVQCEPLVLLYPDGLSGD